jgi:iron complex transport system ATP-binding protein
VTPLVAESVTVTYPAGTVVDAVHLAVEEQEWLALIGPNGAGKTTLLRACAALVAYRGSVRLWGAEVRELSRREIARRVAVVPQNPVIPLEMTVLEYALLGRTPHLGYAAALGTRDAEIARDALRRLGVSELAGRALATLSGGERQRCILARALAQQPTLLLLDEPTSALDVGAQQQVLELVSSLREEHGLTVVSAMHDLTLAAQYADRLVLVDGGRVVASGSPAEVLTPEIVSRHYAATVRIVAGPDGGLAVVPLRVPAADRAVEA